MAVRRALLVGSCLAGLLVSAGSARAADADLDGLEDGSDNCPASFNPLQADCNGDGQGDACSAGNDKLDADQDGTCNAVDNCATANANQSDCNHNGVGDMCEAASANRDDDGDGVCNGVDACPREAVATCGIQAITVPWVPANPTIPHATYSGATHTVKGIARNGGNQFMWDFGDGTAATAWTAITNPYNLGVNHVYTGAVGQTFIATLSVRDSANPAVVSNAFYRVKIGDSGALPAAAPYNMEPNKMDVRIDMAIDQGLWWLHTNMTRGTYADGSPGYAQPYGNWAGNFAGNCTAVDAFFLHGSKPNKDYATDPYVETSQRALNYILANTSTSGIANQTAGKPDYNGNGIGVLFGAVNDTYTNGICGVAVASSGTPTRQSLVGNSAYSIRGRTYQAIVQDMAEWFAYGQADSGVYRGGWQYSSNTNTADGSTNQWPLLAIAAGEDNMAIKTPAFVRTEAPFFMNYSRHATKDNRNGGWGYQGPNDVYVNHAKTAAGMLFHYFEGDSTSHPNVQAALGYLYRYWSSQNYDGGGAWNVGIGNSYAMYGVMKAMRKPQPNILRVVEYNYNTSQQTANSFDWFYTPPGQAQVGLATDLVRRQAANGSWSDSIGNNATSGAFATGWDVLILSKGVTTIPPQAAICNCSFTWDNNQDITMDGSCSTHGDLNRAIVSYEWDFDYQNNTFTSDASGINGTKVGGYQVYGQHPIALRVTDNNPLALGGPQTSLATCSITTRPPNNCPHPEAGPAYLGNHDEPVQLDATGSSDPDGDQLVYAWDFDNDGQFDDATGATPTVTYANVGIFTVAVQVTDIRTDGLTQPCSRVDYSTVEIGNHAPVSEPGGPYSARPGQTIVLSGGGSSDPDGDLITFGWDLNNDGTFNDSVAVGPQFTVPANAATGTVYSVCLKVTDSFQLSSTKCSTVTVQFVNTPPVCSIPQPAVVAQCDRNGVSVTVDGSASADVDAGDVLTYAWTSNCPNGVFSAANAAMTQLSFASVNTSGCTATLTVSDGTASTSCSLPINVVDQIDPQFVIAPADKTVECNADATAIVNAWLGSATAADECSNATLTNDFIDVAGGCGGTTGSALVTWTATDAAGNIAQTAATLSIADTTAPVMACPAPVSLECEGPETAVALAASADDGCTGAIAADGPGEALYPVGTSTVTFSSTDSCGNAASCETTVTVTDTTDPTIACPANATIECNADHSATGVDVADASGSDQCGDTTITGAVDGTYPLGSTTVTQTATDAHGNDASCQSSIIVVDTTRPAIACPADVTVECNALGQADAVDTGHATATDVCTTATVTDPAIGSWPVGTNAATHNAVDEAGNTISCANLVTVVDTTDPTIACPAALTVECNALGSATDVIAGQATATDVCSAVTITDPAAATYPLGTTATTHKATDAAGNETTCAGSVIVVDTTDPSIVCPAALTVECNALGSATDVIAGQATATDVCSTVTVTDPAPATYPLGTTATTHSAIDAEGNETTCAGSVTVADTTAPTLVCPADLTVECNAPGEATGVDAGQATATDVCSAVTVTDPAVGTYALGANTATHAVVDAEGNSTSCANTVNVVDTTDPSIVCPAALTVECNAPGAATDVIAGQATATDVCSAVTVTDPAAATYPLGTTATTHTALDAQGNETTCAGTVIVADTTAPTLVCPADITVECNAQGGATGVDAGQATATDVCSAVTVTDPAIGTYALGANTATHTVVDAEGNTTSCANTVTVIDTTAPVFDPASLGPREVSGSCSPLPVPFELPTATDGCQAVTVTCGTVAGDSIGANTVTCTATDAAGNATTTTITVNVLGPYRIGFTSLVDDNLRDDPATDTDKTNLFKSGTMVPIQMRVYACNGTDVSSTVGATLNLHLTVAYHTGVTGSDEVAIIPDYIGVGDEGGLLLYTGTMFRYNLSTNRFEYPSGTISNAGYFSALVTATYIASPDVVVAAEDARLESK